MPIGPYNNWADCISDQKRKGASDLKARRICGYIEKLAKEKNSKGLTLTDEEIERIELKVAIEDWLG